MEDFMEKWRTDEKFKAKVKLALYGVFMLFVIAYAAIIDRTKPADTNTNTTTQKQETKYSELIDYFLGKELNYTLEVKINDTTIKYIGVKSTEQEKITKLYNDETKEYIYKDNEYYQEVDGQYIKTSQNEVYDVAKYNYISLDVINEYLKVGVKEDNQYKVYLKDVILGNDSDKYFVITTTDNTLHIDYTPFMKEFNSDIEKYTVNYKIEEKE